MVLGPFVEVAVILGLLSGGTLLNRDANTRFSDKSTRRSPDSRSPAPRARSPYDDAEVGLAPWTANKPSRQSSPAASSTSTRSSATVFDTEDPLDESEMHQRTLRLFRWRYNVWTPDTSVFQNRLLSRVLRKFPFLVEAWYWALIYWVYQLGRAFTVLFIIDGSVVEAARRHALQLVHVEQRLRIFVEVPIQQYFMQSPAMMHWINRIYSFIHIPGTILFLIVLYYVTTTRPLRQMHAAQARGESPATWQAMLRSYHPDLYEKRRRTMAMCNLLAFIIFTTWPCMPPRLLSDPNLAGDSEEGLHYGFVDTVHSSSGESSVWTTNRFCNQYAAMPSLHFGYSFLVGLTIATMPLETSGPARRRPSLKRILIVLGALIYPTTILIAIVATANHFVLDAIAGAMVCGLVWQFNGVLLNLLPLEDYFLWALRIHKPTKAPLSDYRKLRSRM